MKRLMTTTLRFRAFDTGSEGWKMNGDSVEMKDGNPVWINADGSESIMKGDTITRLNTESRTHRTAAQEAASKLKAYEGIDPEKARDALGKLKDIDMSKLVDAGKLDEVRNTLKSEYDVQISERDKKLTDMQNRINGMILDNAFTASNYIKENIAIPAEMFRDSFGKFFKIEDGKMQAIDRAGNRIMSKKHIGEYADFDEAIEILVDGYSQKDAILKAPEHRGTGNSGGAGHTGGGRIIRRADFDAASPQKQAEIVQRVTKGEMRLVD